MSASYKPLEIKSFPSTSHATPENRFWKQFKTTQVVKEYAKVSHISFCPTQPFDVAACSSTRVLIYETNTCTLKRTISRFKDVAYGCCYRADGKLILAGSEDGTANMFDTSTRNILRSFKGHMAAIHQTRFLDHTKAFTCSDDKTVRVWDIPTESEVLKYSSHTDYVRACSTLPHTHSFIDPNIFLTGSYDHRICVWDTRVASKPISTFDHQDPVEALVVLPNGYTAISAGDIHMKGWDLRFLSSSLNQKANADPLVSFSGHQKTITSLCLDATGLRLVSGGLDHFVKVHDVSMLHKHSSASSSSSSSSVTEKDLLVTNSWKYNQPILAVALSPDTSCLAVGLVDGTLHLRKKQQTSATSAASSFTFQAASVFSIEHKFKQQQQQLTSGEASSAKLTLEMAMKMPFGLAASTLEEKRMEEQAQQYQKQQNILQSKLEREQSLHGGTRRFFQRGQSAANFYDRAAENGLNPEEDYRVESTKKKRLQPFDELLRKFQYRMALDSALKSRHAVTIVSLLDELVQRGALKIALSGRDEETLSPLLAFFIKYISNPHYSLLLCDVVVCVLDIYSGVVGFSPLIDEQFVLLHRRLQEEKNALLELLKMQSKVDLLLSAASEQDEYDWSTTTTNNFPQQQEQQPEELSVLQPQSLGYKGTTQPQEQGSQPTTTTTVVSRSKRKKEEETTPQQQETQEESKPNKRQKTKTSQEQEHDQTQQHDHTQQEEEEQKSKAAPNKKKSRAVQQVTTTETTETATSTTRKPSARSKAVSPAAEPLKTRRKKTTQ